MSTASLSSRRSSAAQAGTRAILRALASWGSSSFMMNWNISPVSLCLPSFPLALIGCRRAGAARCTRRRAARHHQKGIYRAVTNSRCVCVYSTHLVKRTSARGIGVFIVTLSFSGHRHAYGSSHDGLLCMITRSVRFAVLPPRAAPSSFPRRGPRV